MSDLPVVRKEARERKRSATALSASSVPRASGRRSSGHSLPPREFFAGLEWANIALDYSSCAAKLRRGGHNGGHPRRNNRRHSAHAAGWQLRWKKPPPFAEPPCPFPPPPPLRTRPTAVDAAGWTPFCANCCVHQNNCVRCPFRHKDPRPDHVNLCDECAVTIGLQYLHNPEEWAKQRMCSCCKAKLVIYREFQRVARERRRAEERRRRRALLTGTGGGVVERIEVSPLVSSLLSLSDSLEKKKGEEPPRFTAPLPPSSAGHRHRLPALAPARPLPPPPPLLFRGRLQPAAHAPSSDAGKGGEGGGEALSAGESLSRRPSGAADGSS